MKNADEMPGAQLELHIDRRVEFVVRNLEGVILMTGCRAVNARVKPVNAQDDIACVVHSEDTS